MAKKFRTIFSSNFWISTLIILMGTLVISYANYDTSVNDSSLSEQQLQDALFEAFNELNLSLTNIYVNETYLNETYISNNYYTTNVDNSTYNEFITQITNQYFNELEPVVISGLDSITINDSECSEIDFYIKNTMLSAITDSNDLNMMTSLESITNPSFENSFFIDDSSTLHENNVIVTYNALDSYQKAFRDDSSADYTISFNNSLVNKNLYINFAFEQNSNLDLFSISENGVKTIIVEQYNSDSMRMRNLVTGDYSSAVDLPNDCRYYGNYCLYHFEFTQDFIYFYIQDVLIGILENTFSSSDSEIIIEGESDTYRDFFIRSMYLQQEEIEIVPSLFYVDSNTHPLDVVLWNHVNIKMNGITSYYQIDNNLFNIGYTGEYNLTIDLTKTDIANLFCRVNN